MTQRGARRHYRQRWPSGGGEAMDGELLTDTFVELADTMVADFDVIDFLHLLTQRCVQLLDASAAGVVLADPRGELRLAAASTEAVRVLELFQLQNDDGPCLECFRTGQFVAAPDLAVAQQAWPRFATAAREAGFEAVHALPMRLRTHIIGALNLFRDTPGGLDAQHLRVGQALADVATIGLLQQRVIRQGEVLNEQLQDALSSRVAIEQAKGKLAERLGLEMDQAFDQLRTYARNRNLRLSDLAQAFIEGGPGDFPDLTAPDARRSRATPGTQQRRPHGGRAARR
jgi:transcriptional regulator with GAF, ATPase, and Fis domain